jgi:hypothetical protein
VDIGGRKATWLTPSELEAIRRKLQNSRPRKSFIRSGVIYFGLLCYAEKRPHRSLFVEGTAVFAARCDPGLRCRDEVEQRTLRHVAVLSGLVYRFRTPNTHRTRPIQTNKGCTSE